jgi:hypothetical protein
MALKPLWACGMTRGVTSLSRRCSRLIRLAERNLITSRVLGGAQDSFCQYRGAIQQPFELRATVVAVQNVLLNAARKGLRLYTLGVSFKISLLYVQGDFSDLFVSGLHWFLQELGRGLASGSARRPHLRHPSQRQESWNYCTIGTSHVTILSTQYSFAQLAKAVVLR